MRLVSIITGRSPAAASWNASSKQHLFSGRERLKLRSLGVGVDGALVAPGAPSANGEQCKHLADALLAQLPSFEQIETLLFERALEHSGGNVSAAAPRLRLRRGQVEYRLQEKRSGRD